MQIELDLPLPQIKEKRKYKMEETTLIKDLGMLYPKKTSKRKSHYGLFECPVCKKHFLGVFDNYKKNNPIKCIQCRSMTHKKNNHKLYDTWNGQYSRCNNPKNPQYGNYGGRGIKLSDEFKDINVWIKYVESLPNYTDREKEKLTLDRIDNNKGYERDNLRWASPYIQSLNKRLLKANKSGYTGVFWRKDTKKWMARITVLGKKKNLGCFISKEDALMARNNYIKKNNLPHKIQKIRQ